MLRIHVSHLATKRLSIILFLKTYIQELNTQVKILLFDKTYDSICLKHLLALSVVESLSTCFITEPVHCGANTVDESLEQLLSCPFCSIFSVGFQAVACACCRLKTAMEGKNNRAFSTLLLTTVMNDRAV